MTDSGWILLEFCLLQPTWPPASVYAHKTIQFDLSVNFINSYLGKIGQILRRFPAMICHIYFESSFMVSLREIWGDLTS